MAHIIKHNATGPTKVDCAGKDAVYVCACGLSKTQPLCDGSHAKTRDEGEKIYAYAPDGQRIEIGRLG